jgi:ribose-phosphate pyrophosphokinase
MRLFFAESAKHLQRSFLKHRLPTGRFESYAFADGERGYRFHDHVKGELIGIIGSVLPDPASLFDLLSLCQLAHENGASSITLAIPYLGYARQDRPNREGEGSIGIMVVKLIRRMRPSQLVVCDIHSHWIRKALGSIVTELSALPVFADALSARPPDVIVSPDTGSIPRAQKLTKLFTPPPVVVTIDKERPRPNVAIAKRLHGDVQGKNVLVIDDMIDTGGTLGEAVRLALQGGARKIRLAATHGIFSAGARDRLYRLPVERILVTNTLPQIRYPKIQTLDIVPLLIQALRNKRTQRV